MKRSILFIFVFSMVYSPTHAQDLKTLSRQYIDAYFSMDQENYSQFLAENITWSDPTWSEVDPSNKPVNGKEAVLAHLKTATAGLTNLRYEIEEHFVSGPIAVFEGIMKYTFTDSSTGKSFNFSLREVSVLEFSKGKIIKHTDYSDFKTWLKQYQEQQ
ncbi:MAG: nuclear transport factor 2 family protein [Roseivirga sp.]|nr:nuclear transport factor 2 family protein [Roseivirga sp.]